MLYEIFLAFIQAATEFFPISSSGHLALAEIIFKNKPDMLFFVVLHLASLLAVAIFTRKEIIKLISFDREYRKMWVYLIIATIPAAIFGYFLESKIESSFSSLLFLGLAFMFTGIILLSTKFSSVFSEISWKHSVFIGLFQVLALFPGVSRSGMTISSGLFSGLKREEAVKFSFLLSIPVIFGAFLLELIKTPINLSQTTSWTIPFLVCVIFSLLFLNFLYYIVKRGNLWIFSFYCFLIGISTLILALI